MPITFKNSHCYNMISLRCTSHAALCLFWSSWVVRCKCNWDEMRVAKVKCAPSGTLREQGLLFCGGQILKNESVMWINWSNEHRGYCPSVYIAFGTSVAFFSIQMHSQPLMRWLIFGKAANLNSSILTFWICSLHQTAGCILCSTYGSESLALPLKWFY